MIDAPSLYPSPELIPTPGFLAPAPAATLVTLERLGVKRKGPAQSSMWEDITGQTERECSG